MKKTIIGILLAVVIIAVIGVLVAGAIVGYGLISEMDIVNTDEKYASIAEDVSEYSFDEKTGLLYVNNEIVVLAADGTTEAAIERIAGRYDAEMADSDESMGIYLLRFEDSMDVDGLEDLTERLLEETAIEDAFINPVLESETDLKDAVYPNDPWNGDGWDLDQPKGENWGAEAINAPGAWAYLDQLQSVNVGVIDTYVHTGHNDLDIKALLTVTDTASNYYVTQEIKVSAGEADDHGGHVAGIIGAKWNNGVGVSGITGGKAVMYSSNTVSVETRENDNISRYYSAYEYVKAIKALVNNDVRAINISQNTGRLLGFAASRGNKNAKKLLNTQADIAGRMLSRIIEDIEKNGDNDFVICISAGNTNNTAYYKDDDSTYGYVAKRGLRFWLKKEVGDSYAKYNNFLALIDEPEVKNRIIVVGSVRRDTNLFGKLRENKYTYSDYSCVGDRVDVVAPGDGIYSLTVNGYTEMSGTSMATPHVTAVAGLAFAANPSLSGPDVKNLVVGLSTGRYYYGEDYSGLVNAKLVVEHALATKTGEVVPTVGTKSAGLDLCLIVDTTFSMNDDIDNAKANMLEILNKLSEKTADYRVALIDYRDFADRSASVDYPAKVQLDFSTDKEVINAAIQGLTLGNGGDYEETVYSAIHECLQLDWRPRAQKVIIILGDAPPLDPEPYTGYTYDDMIKALYNADIGIDLENSDDRVLGEPDDSAISVYSIGIGDGAADFFENISGDTGGKYTEVEGADEVSDAIMDSIEQIKVKTVKVNADFESGCSGETVDLYAEDGEYMFSFVLDDNGEFKLSDMQAGKYHWEIQRLGKGGDLRVSQNSKNAKIDQDDNKWYSFAGVIAYRYTVVIVTVVLLLLVMMLVLIFVLAKLMKSRKRKKCAKTVVPDQPPVAAAVEMPVEPVVVAPVLEVEPAVEAPAAPPVQTLFCSQCGQKINSDWACCPNCGSKIL